MVHKNIFVEESILKDLPSPIIHSAYNYGYDIKGSGVGVKIAVIDTGKPDHLALRKSPDSINFSQSHSLIDLVGQATIVGGIINANDPDKMIGMAPDASVYYAKVNGDDGRAGLDAFVSSFLWSIIKGVDIIIMPMTVDVSNDIFQDTVKKAVSSNICVICSAGFYGYKQYPSAYQEVLSVGALSQNGERAGFSDIGTVNAVGTSICSTYINQEYCIARGSAVATAVIGGLAALIVEQAKENGKIEPIKVYKEIEELTKRKKYE